MEIDAAASEIHKNSHRNALCFGRHYHPSSGAQNNRNYSIW